MKALFSTSALPRIPNGLTNIMQYITHCNIFKKSLIKTDIPENKNTRDATNNIKIDRYIIKSKKLYAEIVDKNKNFPLMHKVNKGM